MSDDNKSDGTNSSDLVKITRRRALAGLAVVGTVSASAGAGTSAFFSDTVDTADNTIETGNIDLTTNGDDNPTTTINVGPIGPGQSGTQSLTLRNEGSIDGFLSLDFGTPDSRSELTEILEVTVSIGGTTIRQGTFDTVFDGEGEWSNADIPLSAGSNKPLTIDYELTEGAGNDVAGITAVGDIAIQLNQRPETFADLVVDQTSGNGNVSSIQEAVDNVPEGGVILVRNGTYNEAVTVGTSGVKIASKNGPSMTQLVPDPDTDGNKALLVDGVDDVTVDGLRVSLGADQPDNSEKFAIRGRPDGSGDGPNNLTVRNCHVEDITADDVSSNSGAVRATGIVVDMEPTGGLGPATMSNFVVENNKVRRITCTSSGSGGDSRAKGIGANGDVDGASIVRNVIENIGQDPETDKPRGITLTEQSSSGSNQGAGTTDFTILGNTIQNVAGSAGQPAIFIGGTNALGDSEVYDNVFYHPVDNLSSGTLRLRSNTWENDADDDGVPELVPPEQDEDGGNLIDRNGGSSYDTTYTI